MLPLSLAVAIYLADLDYNGIINWADVYVVLNNFAGAGRGDANRDGVVDTLDYLTVMSVWSAGWGVHRIGDGHAWFIRPGDALGIGPSPFPGCRRLTFLDEHGSVMAIDMWGSADVSAVSQSPTEQPSSFGDLSLGDVGP